MSRTTVASIIADTENDAMEGRSWEVGFIGPDVDERGKAALNAIKGRCDVIFKLFYSPKEGGKYLLDGSEIIPRKLMEILSKRKSCLIEATTLGVIEILWLLKLHRQAQSSPEQVDLLYIEPYEYSKEPGRSILSSREFKLSDNRTYLGVRGFSIEFSQHTPGHAVFMLGFEGERLAQALEQNEFSQWTKSALIGIPAFEPGWEMNAIANNCEMIKANGFSIKYCGAASVLGALEVLREIFDSLRGTDRPTVVVPIGTKPHSIAAAIFLCDESSYHQTAILFDHPQRKEKRSFDIRKWHLYSLTF